MPLYDFICKECDQRFEALVYGSRTAECPNCHSTELEQLLSAFSVGVGRSTACANPVGGRCQAPGG